MTPMAKSSYEPTPEAEALFTRYRRALETERALRDEVKAMAVSEMHAGKVGAATVGDLARLTGMTPEVFRRIARAKGVERRRPPTVTRVEREGDTPSE